jgi:hypothetical protein
MTAIGVASPSLAKSEQKMMEGQVVAGGSKKAAGASDQTMEDKCWEKHLLWSRHKKLRGPNIAYTALEDSLTIPWLETVGRQNI